MNLVVIIIILVACLLVFMSTGALNVIFLLIGAAVAWAIIMRNKDLKKNINPVPEKQLHILNVEQGGVFELRNVGEAGEDMTLKVLAKHLYQVGDFSWFELECDKGSEEKVWVEVEDDDETQVSVVLKKMTLQDIEVGPAYLAQVDENEAGKIQYNKKNYVYTDSDNAVFYRFCDDAKPEKLYYWDFKNGKNLLSVEKWGEKEYEVYLSEIKHSSQITVLRNKE